MAFKQINTNLIFSEELASSISTPGIGRGKLFIDSSNGKVSLKDDTGAVTSLGDNIYTADGTVGAGRVATLTDRLTFQNGRFDKVGATNSSSGINSIFFSNDKTKYIEIKDDATLSQNNGNAAFIWGVNTTGLTQGGLRLNTTGASGYVWGVIQGRVGDGTNTNQTSYYLYSNAQREGILSLYQANTLKGSFRAETNGFIFESGNLGINVDPLSTAKLQVRGADLLGTTSALLVENSAGTDLLDVRNNGNTFVTANIAGGAGVLEIENTDVGTNSGSGLQLWSNGKFAQIAQNGPNVNAGLWSNRLTIDSLSAGSAGMLHSVNSTGDFKWAAPVSGAGSDAEVYMKMTKDGLLLGNGIGTGTPAARLNVRGQGVDSVAFLVENSGLANLLEIKNDNTIGLYGATPVVQATTAGAAATFAANTSGIADDSATFDGYTIGQVVKALRNLGILQ